MQNPFLLEGKAAIITGGGSGIGQKIAERFGEAGAYIHILDINEEGAQNTVQVIQSSGGFAKAHNCNVANQEQVIQIVNSIEKLHPIDILINNAGIGFVGNLENTAEADFDRLFNVNVKGVYNCLFACIKGMKARKKGVIINMASVVSSVGIPDRFAYSMTKGAVLTMTYSVAMGLHK